MARVYIFFCVATMFSLGKVAFAQKFLHPTPVEQDISRMSRDVMNIAELNLTSIDKNSKRPWILASIKHDATSGSVVVRSFGINGDTGKTIKLDGKDTIKMSGDVHILSTLTGIAPKNDNSFNWEFPYNAAHIFGRPNNVIEDSANKFRSFRGTAIFHLPKNWSIPEEVLPIYSIPDEWQKSVLPAWKYSQEHLGMFDAKLIEKNHQQLQELLKNENPFLAIAAGRLLTNEQSIDRKPIETALSASSKLRQAVFTYLLLKNSPPATDESVVKDMGDIVDAATTADSLQGIGLGALTALRENEHHVSFSGFRLLEKLEKKQAALGSKTEADQYVNTILRVASLPLLRQSASYTMSVPPEVEAAK